MARGCRARRISRVEPRYGVVVRRGARPSPAGSPHRLARARADRLGSCGVGCGRCARLSVGGLVCGRMGIPRRRRARLDRLGALPLALQPSSSRALRHAGGARRSFRVVVSDGGCPWRRPDVVAGPDAAVSPQRCRRAVRWRPGSPVSACIRWRCCPSRRRSRPRFTSGSDSRSCAEPG